MSSTTIIIGIRLQIIIPIDIVNSLASRVSIFTDKIISRLLIRGFQEYEQKSDYVAR